MNKEKNKEPRYIDADVLKQFRNDVIKGKIDIKNECDLIDACPTANVVEVNVFDEMLKNAMAIPKPMHLYIYFADEHVEKHMVTRFTDLSQTTSRFYYYEEPHHEPGKGKVFCRDEIKCFEVSFCSLHNWEQHLKNN